MIATPWTPTSSGRERRDAGDAATVLAMVTRFGSGAKGYVLFGDPPVRETFFTFPGGLDWADKLLRERGVTLPEDPQA